MIPQTQPQRYTCVYFGIPTRTTDLNRTIFSKSDETKIKNRNSNSKQPLKSLRFEKTALVGGRLYILYLLYANDNKKFYNLKTK